MIKTVSASRKTLVFKREYGSRNRERQSLQLGILSISPVLGVTVDMHDHKDCEERLFRAQAALLRSEQLALAGSFAGAVMHEVNNPLEALGNLVYLASQDAADPEMVRHYLRIAQEQLLHVQSIARKTLAFYRPNSGRSEVDLVQVLDSALHLQRPQLMAKSIMVHREQPGEAPIKAHAGELLQVFTNLIANAIEALHTEGVLHVRVSKTDGHIHILIADNGSGISREQQERLFEAFATSGKEKGTGMGLWTSKALVEKHRGRIRHRSSTTPGRKGTAFRISLPR